MSTLIKDMTPDDKPREKAIKYGFASLSDLKISPLKMFLVIS